MSARGCAEVEEGSLRSRDNGISRSEIQYCFPTFMQVLTTSLKASSVITSFQRSPSLGAWVSSTDVANAFRRNVVFPIPGLPEQTANQTLSLLYPSI